MTPDSSRWLVTINGQVPTNFDLNSLNQTALSAMLTGERAPSLPARAIFVSSAAADCFRRVAAREFPEDDVRLWASLVANSRVADLHAAVLSAIESADWEPGDAQRDLQRLRDQYQAMFPADTKER